MTSTNLTAVPSGPRWFLTESAQTWHILSGDRALCRSNVRPRVAHREGVSNSAMRAYPLPIPRCLPCMRKLSAVAPSADAPQFAPVDIPQGKPVSVVYGHVRLATVSGWDAARDALRADINQSYRNVSHSTIAARQLAELARVDAGPDSGGYLVTSGPFAWADSMRYAQEGLHGITDGSLALVHDYANGQSRYGWTIDVKCKVIAVTDHNQRVRVRITGDSSQFTRGETVTLHASFLRPRGGR